MVFSAPGTMFPHNRLVADMPNSRFYAEFEGFLHFDKLFHPLTDQDYIGATHQFATNIYAWSDMVPNFGGQFEKKDKDNN